MRQITKLPGAFRAQGFDEEQVPRISALRLAEIVCNAKQGIVRLAEPFVLEPNEPEVVQDPEILRIAYTLARFVDPESLRQRRLGALELLLPDQRAAQAVEGLRQPRSPVRARAQHLDGRSIFRRRRREIALLEIQVRETAESRCDRRVSLGEELTVAGQHAFQDAARLLAMSRCHEHHSVVLRRPEPRVVAGRKSLGRAGMGIRGNLERFAISACARQEPGEVSLRGDALAIDIRVAAVLLDRAPEVIDPTQVVLPAPRHRDLGLQQEIVDPRPGFGPRPPHSSRPPDAIARGRLHSAPRR